MSSWIGDVYSMFYKLGHATEGGSSMGVVPRMHNMSGLSLAGHLHLGR